VADFLAERGHRVTVVYATNGPAPLLGRYIIGGILGRLDAAGVTLRFMEEVVAIGTASVTVRNVYSLRTRDVGEFDSVVLACGSVSDATLYAGLKGRVAEVHVLGDAYAPRRLVSATRQAYALAARLVGAPAPEVPVR
jgi:NADPH-dependent 2,4-dienoyl-CoA reductase/sulfur reductase-like enzyme